MKTVLVPVEATEEMREAARRQLHAVFGGLLPVYGAELDVIFRAMAEARPASCALLLEAMEKVIEALDPKRACWSSRLFLTAHNIDIVIRKDGIERRIEGDFLKAAASALSLLSQAREQTKKP